jgi:hypothetical protein
MTHDPSNPFGDFEDDFQKTEKAAAAATPGRVPEETYKFVLTAVDLKDDGVLVDKEAFVANSGSKGFKLFCEIVEPESVPNPTTGEPHITKGAVLEHVFWITEKNLPYAKRDLATILERDDFKLSELMSINWAGRTFEGVVKDEKRDGFVRSRIAFINPWIPAKDKKDPAKGDAKPAVKPEPKKTEPVKGDAKPPAKTGAKTTGQASSW